MELATKQHDWTKIAEIELVYKTTVKPSERPKLTSAIDAFHFLVQTWDPNKLEFIEQFKVLLLNRAMKVLGIYEVSSGTTVGCIVDAKLVLCAAIKANASNLILCHNHPSGNLNPSESDKSITQKLKMASTYHDFKITDHIIISKESYFSFAEQGLL